MRRSRVSGIIYAVLDFPPFLETMNYGTAILVVNVYVCIIDVVFSIVSFLFIGQ